MENLLLVDDDLSLRETLRMHFEEMREGSAQRYAVHTAGSLREARALAEKIGPDLIILDMQLPDGSALDVLPELKAVAGDAPVLIVTAHANMETTIRAMKMAAFDFLRKPFDDVETLDRAVTRALEMRRLSRRAAALRVEEPPQLGDIVGNSPRMQQILKEIGKVAASRASVLITGESGTGKELIARVIHNYSDEKPRPFVGINCSAIVDTLLESELFGHEKGSFTGAQSAKPGKFELAENGTIFLDEIGDMSLALQAKLLRVLQEREFERVGGVRRLRLRARVVAATNRDLPQEVTANRFREDLYQRLKVVTIEVPPLRERREDIPALVQSLLAKINEKVHKQVNNVPAEVLEYLCMLPWPGNVRELENVLTRAIVLSPGDVLLREHLPSIEGKASVAAPPTEEGFPTLEEAERVHVLKALEITRWHKGRACQLLGISRPTLERKLKKYRGEKAAEA
ncbi:MAG TPA: sigma-54-dependent Fis family transcriptional regulator [Myxococcales bacterium]|jgi:two-component system response regulator AtoC|nr:sigma-54-dependent Fis family transcriptional regulator [Myxococcales bacterium]